MTSQEAFKLFGFDSHSIEKHNMILFDVPTEYEIGAVPKRVYCNKLLVEPLKKGIANLIARDCVDQLRTWDGCYNPRPIRGYEAKFAAAIKAKDFLLAAKYTSMHYWGLAFDVNAAWNGLGKTPTLSAEFVECFTDAGLDWGGNFNRLDGMHFQLK